MYKMDVVWKKWWKDRAENFFSYNKIHFLRLSARCVRAVSLQREIGGLAYARKAMIIIGLALSTNDN